MSGVVDGYRRCHKLGVMPVSLAGPIDCQVERDALSFDPRDIGWPILS